jgi:hypothetical protein
MPVLPTWAPNWAVSCCGEGLRTGRRWDMFLRVRDSVPSMEECTIEPTPTRHVPSWQTGEDGWVTFNADVVPHVYNDVLLPYLDLGVCGISLPERERRREAGPVVGWIQVDGGWHHEGEPWRGTKVHATGTVRRIRRFPIVYERKGVDPTMLRTIGYGDPDDVETGLEIRRRGGDALIDLDVDASPEPSAGPRGSRSA